MRIDKSYDHPGKFDLFLVSEYAEDAVLTLQQVAQLRAMLDQFLTAYTLGLLERLSGSAGAANDT